MTIGERIKARRKELGFSAENIAEKLNVSPATIYRYENGDIAKIPGSVLEPLAEILQTTPAFLMGWNDQEERSIPSEDEELKQIWEKIKSGNNRALLIGFNGSREYIELTDEQAAMMSAIISAIKGSGESGK
jgi:DNA-binding helix-turn-helix protein